LSAFHIKKISLTGTSGICRKKGEMNVLILIAENNF